MHSDFGITLISLLGKQRYSKAKEQSLYRTVGNTNSKPMTTSHMVSPSVQHSLEKKSSRKNKIAGFFLFTSLEVTFSRSLLIMMLRSLALMSRSVRSLSVGLKRKRRGCFQAGSKCTVQLILYRGVVVKTCIKSNFYETNQRKTFWDIYEEEGNEPLEEEKGEGEISLVSQTNFF